MPKIVRGRREPAWNPVTVSAKRIPQMVRRTHMEHSALRRIFAEVQPESIAEFGCGYGRLLPVAEEFTHEIYGFERERKMVQEGLALFPNLRLATVADLSRVPLADDAVDLAFSFTVLQHIETRHAERIIETMRAVARRYVLIVEETDPSYRRRPDNREYFTIGRSVSWYREQMAGWDLVKIERRPNEPGYAYRDKPKPYSGHYMLFKAGK